MFFIVVGAWLAGVVISLVNHNRKLPLWVLGIGLLVLAGHFTIGLGYLTISVMGLLAVVIWIANKLDMN